MKTKLSLKRFQLEKSNRTSPLQWLIKASLIIIFLQCNKVNYLSNKWHKSKRATQMEVVLRGQRVLK